MEHAEDTEQDSNHALMVRPGRRSESQDGLVPYSSTEIDRTSLTMLPLASNVET